MIWEVALEPVLWLKVIYAILRILFRSKVKVVANDFLIMVPPVLPARSWKALWENFVSRLTRCEFGIIPRKMEEKPFVIKTRVPKFHLSRLKKHRLSICSNVKYLGGSCIQS